ncbi:membrane transporter [Pyrenochaeta sp. DS3sAY3a]|nr:membrane transporter [Pyrenochaeta sp. DS3sAY3a]
MGKNNEKVVNLQAIKSATDMGNESEILNGEIIACDAINPTVAAKMVLVNEAINQLGFTGYHWKLFFLNGFGYAVDSLLAFLMSIAAGQVDLEFSPSYKRGGQVSLYVGLLVGALFWGLGADIVGRKWAFNFSLLVASLFAIVAGASPNYIVWCTFVAISAFGAGGNLVLDTTIFLEFLPANKQWMVTLMAMWWGVGQVLAGLFAWAFIPNFSCISAEACERSNNMGWRYLYFTSGAFVLLLSIARVTVIRFHETPKYLLSKGRDLEVVNLLQTLSSKYNKPCSITSEQLSRCGSAISGASTHSSFSLVEIAFHYRGLFSFRKLAYSTTLVWLSWMLIGLAYPLFYVFLPEYLASRGAQFGQTSPNVTWRNYVITQICAIPGPILAAALCRLNMLGRKYTMVIGALISMAFFFAYTAIRSNAENLGFNCAVSAAVNIYYGTLYAYSPEVMPSAHRATGNGTAVALNRLMGIMAAVIATYADTSTAAPVYICAALFGGLAIISFLLPFEPQNSQSS